MISVHVYKKYKVWLDPKMIGDDNPILLSEILFLCESVGYH